MIRMFREADAPAATAAPAINPAEYMARQGVKTDSDTDAVPDIKTSIPEQNANAPAASSNQAEPVSTGSNPQAAAVASEPPAAQPVKPESPAQAASVTGDWKQQLKKVAETEILKELGYDDKIVGLLNRWKTGGSVTDYLQAASVDYSKMSALDVMKHSLRAEHPELSEEDFEELYRMSVVEQFKLDPDQFTEQEVRRGNILLNAQAKSHREKLIQKQQDYLLPKAPETKPVTREDIEQEQAAEYAEQLNKYKATVNAHPYVVDLLKNKAMAIGEGEERFNYTVESPEKLINLLSDQTAYGQTLKNEDGTLNAEKMILLSAIADNHKLFLSELAKHYKAIGARRTVDQLENAAPPAATSSNNATPDLSPAAALAKGGVLVHAS